MSIYLLHRISRAESVRYKIPCSDLQETVKSLKERFINCFEAAESPIDLIYRGIILEDTKTLSQTGIKPNVVVYIYTKPAARPEPELLSIPGELIMQVHKFITTVNSHQHHRNAFMKINRPENFERILKKTPSIKEDPTVRAMLEDPFLIMTLTDLDSLKSIAVDHPALIEAFREILEVLKDLRPNAEPDVPGTSSGITYPSDYVMHDSDSESSGSEYANNAANNVPSARNLENGITANQLSAALAFANGPPNLSTPELHHSNSDTLNSNTNNSIITSSMFNHALTRAMSHIRLPAMPEVNTRNRYAQESNQGSSLATQLHRMRELGLRDDAINIQALVISNGDVQTAINLILSGAVGED